MYDLVGDRLQEIFDAQVVDIGVLDPDAGLIHFPYTIEKGERFPTSRSGRGVPQARHRDAGAAPGQRATSGTLAEYGQPVVLQGEVAEVVGVRPARRRRRGHRAISRSQNVDREHAFGEADLRLLTTLAGSLSVALENARLFEETRQRNAELALINDVQARPGREPRHAGDVRPRRRPIQEIFDAQVVDIAVIDPATGSSASRTSSNAATVPDEDPIELIGHRRHRGRDARDRRRERPPRRPEHRGGPAGRALRARRRSRPCSSRSSWATASPA